jgi:hypothetical protein
VQYRSAPLDAHFLDLVILDRALPFTLHITRVLVAARRRRSRMSTLGLQLAFAIQRADRYVGARSPPDRHLRLPISATWKWLNHSERSARQWSA